MKGDVTNLGADHFPVPLCEKWHSTWPFTGFERVEYQSLYAQEEVREGDREGERESYLRGL